MPRSRFQPRAPERAIPGARTRRARLLATALAAILPWPALAEVTAADIWADWQAQARMAGQELTATSAASPGRIVLTDVTMRTRDEGQGGSTVSVPLITLVEEGGAVAVQFPDDQIVTRRTDAAGEVLLDRIALHHPGLAVTAEGTPDDIAYRYAAPAITARMEGPEGSAAAPAPATSPAPEFEITFTTVTGDSRSTLRDGGREQTSAFRAASAVTSFSASGETANASGRAAVDEIGYTAHGILPLGAEGAADASRLLAAGEWETTLTHGPANLAVAVEGQPPFTARTTGGRSTSTLQGGRVSGAGSWQAGEIALVLPGSDTPAGLAFDSATTSFALPLAPAEAAAPFAFSATLDQIVANAVAWNLFDPRGILPRDPGQITLDLSGRMRVTEDVTDSAALEAAPGLPFAVESLDINSLLLSLAGAKLSGTGALTMNGGDPDSPLAAMPVGALDLLLTGGDRLLDGLVKLGLLPQAQAMMVRMMASGYSRPGAQPDSLTTRVEFHPDGSITANGRPLR